MSDHFEPAGLKPTTTPAARAGRITNIGLTDAARDQATGYIERRKSEMARFIAELAKALRGGSPHGGEPHSATSQTQSSAKPFVDGVASSLDALAATIDERGVGELYREVETVARRHPGMALLVAVAVGVGALHLVRASTGTSVSTSNRPHL